MTVSAVGGIPVSVNPVNVRYSLFLDSPLPPTISGQLHLQRAEQKTDGTWMDDPHVGSFIDVVLPSDAATTTAVQGILALLPTLLAPLGFAGGTITAFRLRLNGFLTLDQHLDVRIAAQVAAGSWQNYTIPSLTAFLTANPTLAVQVETAWAALDAAINAANAQEGWL